MRYTEPVKPLKQSYLIFCLASDYFAFSQSQVSEVLARPGLTEHPGLPSLIAGFVNIEGQALAVIDIARVLGFPALPSHPDQHLIVFKQIKLACVVERVVDFCELEPALDLAGDHVFNTLGAGLLNYQGQQTILLDAQALLLAEEKQRLLDFEAQAQARLKTWPIAEQGNV